MKKDINYYKGKMRTPQFSKLQAQPAIQNFRVISVNKQTEIKHNLFKIHLYKDICLKR